MSKIFKDLYEYKGTFDDFVKLFMEGKLEQGNYFFHLKSAHIGNNIFSNSICLRIVKFGNFVKY